MVAPEVSVLTSSMNRSSYLPRVWKSLNNQTIKNFEWVIGDDGSSDNTAEVIEMLSRKSSFPITVIAASERIGKSMIDNYAISHANGKYILLCDSDDWLEPFAIEQMLKSVQDKGDDDNFLGSVGLCQDNLGSCTGEFPTKIKQNLKMNDLFYKYEFKEDCAVLLKTSILKQHPFPEIDFYTPEACIWTKIGKKYVQLCNTVVLNKEYKSNHAISFSNSYTYSRGKAFSLSQIYLNLSKKETQKFNIYLDLFTYLRFGFHGDVKLIKLFIWFPKKFWILMAIIFPISYIFSLKDRLQKKVNKTHKGFEIASTRYTIKLKTYGK